jgi:hypothetical protein
MTFKMKLTAPKYGTPIKILQEIYCFLLSASFIHFLAGFIMNVLLYYNSTRLLMVLHFSILMQVQLELCSLNQE